jgi:hypothetical protein
MQYLKDLEDVLFICIGQLNAETGTSTNEVSKEQVKLRVHQMTVTITYQQSMSAYEIYFQLSFTVHIQTIQ